MTTHTIRDAEPADEARIREIVGSILQEFGMALDPTGTDSDLIDTCRNYRAGGGAFRVAVDPAGQIVGCAGLYAHDPEQAEIRKMYLLPTERGRGLGRALLVDIVTTARARGFRRITLETASVLRRAIELYQAFGFTEVVHEHHTPRCDRTFSLDL